MTEQKHRRLTKNEQTHMARRMARVCESLGNHDSTIGRLLQESHKSAAAEERSHRNFGRRLVGDIGVRLSVDNTAWLFAARAFFSPEFGKDYTAADLATMREDYRVAIMARALAETRPKVYGGMSKADMGEKCALTLYAYAREIFDVPPPGKTGQAYGVEGISVWDYSRDVAGN